MVGLVGEVSSLFSIPLDVGGTIGIEGIRGEVGRVGDGREGGGGGGERMATGGAVSLFSSSSLVGRRGCSESSSSDSDPVLGDITVE